MLQKLHHCYFLKNYTLSRTSFTRLSYSRFFLYQYDERQEESNSLIQLKPTSNYHIFEFETKMRRLWQVLINLGASQHLFQLMHENYLKMRLNVFFICFWRHKLKVNTSKCAADCKSI